MDRATEIKVGALVLGAISLLVVLVLLIGDFSFQKGQEIQVDYVFIGSLQSGAAVRTSGIKVGKVQAIEFMGGEKNPETGEPVQIRLTLWIEKRALNNVRKGARFAINTEGVLGEQYVEIMPGPGDQPHIEPGAIVRGDDPPRTDLLMQKAFQLVDGLNSLLGDGERFDEMVKSTANLLTNLNEILKNNKENLGPLIKNVNELTLSLNQAMGTNGDVRKTLDNIKFITTELRRDLPTMTAQMRTSMGDIGVASQNMVTLTDPKTGALITTLAGIDNGIVHFDRTVGGVDNGVAHLMKTIDHLDAVIAAAEKLLVRVESGPARLLLGSAPEEEAKPEPKKAEPVSSKPVEASQSSSE